MILDRVSSGLNGPPFLSGMVLALANMVPIIGAIMWEWGTYEILGVYWMEGIILTGLNIPRMLMAQKRPKSVRLPAPKLTGILFFLIQFGIYCSVFAFFVLFLKEDEAFVSPLFAAPLLFVDVLKIAGWAVLFLFLSHLFSFLWNFIGQREYRETILENQKYEPFRRLVVLQTIVLLGAFAVTLLGSATIMLLVLIAAKTTLDLGFHFYAHATDPDGGRYEKNALA